MAQCLGLTAEAYEIVNTSPVPSLPKRPVSTSTPQKELVDSPASSKTANQAAGSDSEAPPAAKRHKPENILKVTAEGLKAVGPVQNSATNESSRVDVKTSDSVAVAANLPDKSSNQGQRLPRVFAVNPQSKGKTTAPHKEQTVVPTLLPVTSSTEADSKTTSLSSDGNAVTVTATTTFTTPVTEVIDSKHVTTASAEKPHQMSQGVAALSQSVASTMQEQQDQPEMEKPEENGLIQVMQGPSAGEGIVLTTEENTEVIEQQQLLPGEVRLCYQCLA